MLLGGLLPGKFFVYNKKKQRPGTHSTLTVGANDYSRLFCSFYLLMTICDTVGTIFYYHQQSFLITRGNFRLIMSDVRSDNHDLPCGRGVFVLIRKSLLS